MIRKENQMPKMKTKTGAKKRFRVTGSGKVKFKAAKTSHLMMNKPKASKRKSRGMQLLCVENARTILENYVPYLRGRKKASRPSPAPKSDNKAA
jgi:large subunit ribosomal protein L35